jgi:integrase
MLLMASATPGYTAKQMGHSVDIFLSTYGKWIDGGQNEVEQARLESFLSAAPTAVKAAV